MKCVCGTTLKPIKTEMDLYDGSISVKNVDAYYCPHCKEEIFTAEQGENIREKLQKINPIQAFSTRKKIIKVGNTLAIPVSKEMAEFMHLKKGQEAEISVKDKNRLILSLG